MNGDRKGDSGYRQAQKASVKCKGTKIFVLRKSGYCPKEGIGVLGNVNYHFVRVETVSRLGCGDVQARVLKVPGEGQRKQQKITRMALFNASRKCLGKRVGATPFLRRVHCMFGISNITLDVFGSLFFFSFGKF